MVAFVERVHAHMITSVLCAVYPIPLQGHCGSIACVDHMLRNMPALYESDISLPTVQCLSFCLSAHLYATCCVSLSVSLSVTQSLTSIRTTGQISLFTFSMSVHILPCSVPSIYVKNLHNIFFNTHALFLAPHLHTPFHTSSHDTPCGISLKK